MLINRLRITAPLAHFKVPYASKEMLSYKFPPPSTVLGMLKVIFGEHINHFTFGYSFKSKTSFKEKITIHKINVKAEKNEDNIIKITKGASGIQLKRGENNVTDCCTKEYLYDCELYIYTDLEEKISLQHCLTMGRSNCIARLHFPIEKVNLTEQEGIGINQFTPIEVGKGMIRSISVSSQYDPKQDCFDTKILHLRGNETFEYYKNHDPDLEHNIILWRYEDGEVYVC